MAKKHYRKGMGETGKYAGAFSGDTDNELAKRENDVREQLYNEERIESLSDFGGEGNPRSDIMADLREQFAETQRELKRRGGADREWGFTGLYDTAMDVFVKANGAGDMFSAATAQQQLGMLKDAVKEENKNHYAMGSKSALDDVNELISETEDVLKRKWGI